MHNCNKKKSNFYLFYLFFKLIYFVVYFIMRHTDRYKLIIKITSAISKQLAASFFDYELLEIQLSSFLGLLRQLRAFFFHLLFFKKFCYFILWYFYLQGIRRAASSWLLSTNGVGRTSSPTLEIPLLSNFLFECLQFLYPVEILFLLLSAVNNFNVKWKFFY